jgi:DNA repair protein RecO (recombination protein O)
MEYKYTGIILSKRDVGETDRICTIYTLEGGKIRSLAKGVRKPHAKLASSLENITLADITIVRTKGMGKITGSIIENNFTALKRDYDAIREVFSAVSLFDKIIDFESPDQNVFGLLRDFLEAVDSQAAKENNEKYALLRLGFTVKLLFELGYAIEVNSCVACRRTLSQDALFFSSERGGVLCKECAKENAGAMIPIKANAVKMIRIFLQNNMKALAKIQADMEDCDSARLAIDDFLRWNI